MLTRPSARAKGPPGQEWTPRPKAMWDWALGRSTRNSAGHSKCRGSRLAAPLSSMTGVPAAISTSADRRRAAGEPEVGLHRALDPQHLFEEVGDPVAVGPQLVLQLGVLGQVLQRGGQQPGRCLLAGGEQERRGPHHRGDVGRGAVGVGGQRQVGEHVLARLAPPVLDVLGEPLVEPGQRVLARAPLLAGADLADGAAQAEAVSEALVVLLGHPEQVGDHQHGEGLGVGADELAPAVADELVELLVGEAPDELLVVLQPLRGDQPHQQGPLAGVVGRVHRHHVLVHRQLVPVAIDDVADVVALAAAPGRWRTDR